MDPAIIIVSVDDRKQLWVDAVYKILGTFLPFHLWWYSVTRLLRRKHNTFTVGKYLIKLQWIVFFTFRQLPSV